MNLFPLILMFASGLILTVADVIMKKWTLNYSTFLLIAGMSVYMVGLMLLAFSFKYKNIAVASAICVTINIVALSIVSWLYFKEALTPLQIVGVLLGISSILFLELG